MFVERSTKSGGVVPGPVLPVDPLLAAVHALHAGVILDVQARYLSQPLDNAAAAFRSLNVADDTVLSLFDTNRPELQPDGHGLRFGPSIALKRSDDAPLEMDGDYSVAWLAKVEAGSGGMVLGQQQSGGSASWAGYDYSTGAMTVVHGGARYVLTAAEFDDNQWHYFMAAYDRDASSVHIYIDGAYAATATGATTGWGVEGRVLIGAVGTQAVEAYFDGILGALAVFPGRCLAKDDQAAEREAVHSWLLQVKARMDD